MLLLVSSHSKHILFYSTEIQTFALKYFSGFKNFAALPKITSKKGKTLSTYTQNSETIQIISWHLSFLIGKDKVHTLFHCFYDRFKILTS